MQEYNPQKIETKWQKHWEQEKIFEAKDNSKKPKFYVLDMFPYPSGAGLHVGHPRGYIGTDVVAHYMRMKGYNVLHPMGWDAFGLPAENYAIKTGIHPFITTKENIARFKKQMRAIGLSYDWSREINTTDPDYYKWTQWIFLKLFEKGLAYRAELPINWCPSCKTGLANEEVIGGRCERCGAQVTKKNIKQWVLKITDYAEKLLQDLDKLDWPEQIKEMQRNWIGKSEGAEIEFSISVNQGSNQRKSAFIKVFTTRPDTIFGATFMVLAPEHPFVASLLKIKKDPTGRSLELQQKSKIKNIEELKEYINKTKKKADRERIAETKDKSGVEIKGIKAINPVNQKKIPIYIADYVLPHYGYGAIMGVPAYDERDFAFAKKYNLPIESIELDKSQEQATKWLQKIGCAKPAVNYKLRDWIFSRQRYWGEPIPLVFCPACKKQLENPKPKTQNPKFNKGELLNPGWVALPEEELPLTLPEVKKYEPTGTGESPLALQKDWVKTTCPKCGGKAIRETNTMPQWAGSCWYFIAYAIKEARNAKRKAQNKQSECKKNKFVWDKEEIKYWLPVDFYVGGAEHAVLHLLYSRFWIKVLCHAGIVNFDESFLKLRTIGLILAPDGQKMSKSRGNVINPDEIIEKYGADAFRIYEMFMGPFDQPIAWDPQGIIGAQRFLQKVWRIKLRTKKPKNQKTKNLKLERLIHKTIKKVNEDIKNCKFNTAISALMILVNELEKEKELSVVSCQLLVKLLAPFAPHLAEELWHELGNKESVFKENWPTLDLKLIKEETFILIIQVNGRVRDQIEVPAGISAKEAQKAALKSVKVQKWLDKKEIKKTIFVKNKLINFVCD